MHYMCVYCVENVLTASTYISSNTLEILTTSLTVSTYTAFNGMVPKLFGIKNLLNIKKVIGMWMCFVLTALTYIALITLHALILCLDSDDIHNIHNIQCISHFDQCIDHLGMRMKPLYSFMYTQIR